MNHYRFFKDIIDRIAAFLALVLLSPFLVFVCCLVLIRLGSPIFFFQQRPGYKGKTFHLFKFRSMTLARDVHGDLLPDSDRLTPFGKWLRATSIDELPALINILRGEMGTLALFLLIQYLDLYSVHQYHHQG